jgi:hypothetical protein
VSRSDIPDWVRLACNRWGRQKRRVWSGRDWHGNVDGYAQSLLGRIRDEREGAGQGARKQHWPEVYWGDALEVQRVLFGMPEQQFCALHFQHVWDPEWGITAERKARYLSIGRTEYVSLIGRAETWVHARLEVKTEVADAQLVEQVNKIVREALNSPASQATKAHTRESCRSRTQPELDLAALNRHKLTVSR